MTVDVEITNRCNARCTFCPRDQTPHEGSMSRAVFDQTLRQVLAHRALLAARMPEDALPAALEAADVSLCGLGEPLLHRDAARFVAQVHDAGIVCSLSTNGALLTEEKGRALLDAGLDKVFVNIGDVDDDYEAVYGLPFERTVARVVRFAEMAEDRCEVRIVLVDHRDDLGQRPRMEAFWRERGLRRFLPVPLINRGGALFVERMQYEAMPEQTEAASLVQARGEAIRCPVPFLHVFVGYDGLYYLCSSDWKKETPMGNVFDHTFLDVTQRKLDLVASRALVCRSCSHDPRNRLATALRARAEGDATDEEVDALLGVLVAASRLGTGLVGPLLSPRLRAAPLPSRRFIPVSTI